MARQRRQRSAGASAAAAGRRPRRRKPTSRSSQPATGGRRTSRRTQFASARRCRRRGARCPSSCRRDGEQRDAAASTAVPIARRGREQRVRLAARREPARRADDREARRWRRRCRPPSRAVATATWLGSEAPAPQHRVRERRCPRHPRRAARWRPPSRPATSRARGRSERPGSAAIQGGAKVSEVERRRRDQRDEVAGATGPRRRPSTSP